MAISRFAGGCEFDSTSGEVRRDDTTVRLEPQPAAVLSLLLSRAGEIVSQDEIKRAVWGDGTHVNLQDAVHYCVRRIRTALGDNPKQPRFVETIPRRGYRFRQAACLPAGRSEDRPLQAWAPPANRVWPTAFHTRLALACLALLLATTTVVERRPNNHHQIAVAVLKHVHDLVF
jgi:DNA-binding winged helix-turn-helix (wHTH) protein